MFVLQNDVGITRCECGAEICCDGVDMPVRCPECGETLDYTFADADVNDVRSLVKMVEEGASLKLFETTKDGKYRLNVPEGEKRVWKDIPLYQAAKLLLAEENGVLELQTMIRETKALRWKAYERYRLNWMLNQGFGIQTLFDAIADYAEADDEKDDRIAEKHAVSDLFANWENEAGFNGSLWACYDEFIGAEYQDIFTMLRMLPRQMHRQYLDDYARLSGYKPASLFVTTKSGTQYVERCFVTPGPFPKLFRYRDLPGEKAPLTVQWREARVLQDTGEAYSLEKNGKEWEIEPF